jgi:hypothetical protein
MLRKPLKKINVTGRLKGPAVVGLIAMEIATAINNDSHPHSKLLRSAGTDFFEDPTTTPRGDRTLVQCNL